ncbi:hypothetical protein P4S58_14350 [Vibrio sp. Hal054]
MSDITDVQSDEDVHDFSLVTDACIMDYELRNEMKAMDVVMALDMAI